eukprot:scaffold9283_cov39-Tisochrysis_lutea.AAC.1
MAVLCRMVKSGQATLHNKGKEGGASSVGRIKRAGRDSRSALRERGREEYKGRTQNTGRAPVEWVVGRGLCGVMCATTRGVNRQTHRGAVGGYRGRRVRAEGVCRP